MQVLAVIIPYSRATSNFALSCLTLRLWISNNGFPIKTSKGDIGLANFQFYKSLDYPDIDEWMRKKVFTAIRDAKTNDLQLLLEYKANVNARDKDGDTALTIAVLYGRFNCIKLLLDHKADLEIKDKYGNTALSLAVYFGKLQCLRLLLQSGADPETKNNKRVTPLSRAKGPGRVAYRRLLLQYIAEEP